MEIGLSIVFAATVAGWVFGAVYYGSLAKPWMAAAELTETDINAAEGVTKFAPYAIGFISEFVMAYVFAGLLIHTAPEGFGIGAAIAAAFYLWIGFVATTVLVNNRFGMRKLSLAVIDSGHWLGVLVIQAIVFFFLGQS